MVNFCRKTWKIIIWQSARYYHARGTCKSLSTVSQSTVGLTNCKTFQIRKLPPLQCIIEELNLREKDKSYYWENAHQFNLAFNYNGVFSTVRKIHLLPLWAFLFLLFHDLFNLTIILNPTSKSQIIFLQLTNLSSHS